jgi:hypothetical protein
MIARLNREHNFDGMARMLQNGESRLLSACAVNGLGVAERSPMTTSALEAWQRPSTSTTELQKVAPRSSLRCVEMLLVAIIVDPTAPVCSFDGRHLPTAERPLPLPQQFQCRASGFVQSRSKGQLSGKSSYGKMPFLDSKSTACEFFTDDDLWHRCCGRVVPHIPIIRKIMPPTPMP